MHGFRHQHRDFAHWRGGLFLRHHRHGRRGRVFEQGDLRYVILALIAEKPAHGYELIKSIEERLGGAYSPSPGVVYPTLTLLEEMGYVSAAPAEGSKKAYRITPEGEAALEANRASVDAIFSRIDAYAQRMGGGAPAPIVRAMENLRLALRLRLEKGRPTDDEIIRIAKILDEATQSVEAS